MQQDQKTIGHVILARMDSLDVRLRAIEEAANSLRSPMPATGKPFPATVASLLTDILAAAKVNRTAIEELHDRLNEPGIARAITKAIRD